ncbi:MFS transporter [Natronomonas gomsonensis]|uniref:MFS transporter n=1 Tax=Natronomonas gomsonensis TaxID=1046043 RepID=UPI0020CA7D22|nr:MFS transporter [Natronomonas gomsonensis]MCY4729927.1 MFS transporter [Natronomonas gomsonensis]
MTASLRQWLSNLNIYYGWFVVVACFLSAMAAFGTIYSFSVFFGHIATAFDQSSKSTSLIFSLQSVVTYTGAAVVGLYVDRIGVRRLLVMAMVLVGGGLYGASQLRSLWGVTLAYGLVAAAGFAIIITIAMATTPRWFGRRRGLANGIATSGTGVGLLLAPPFASGLIDLFGWRTAYLGFTVVVVAILGLAMVLLADGPETIDIETGDEFLDMDNTVATAVSSEHSPLHNIAVTVRHPSFLLVFFAVLLVYMPVYVVLVYLVEFAASIGAGRTTGVLAVSVVGVTSIVGRNAAGVASDWFGRSYLAAACALVIGASSISLTIFNSPVAVLALAVVFGVGYGGIGSLLSPLLAELFGTGDLYALFGLTSISFAMAGSIGPYLSGVGYDVFGTFQPVFVTAGVVALLAVGIFVGTAIVVVPASEG